MAFFIFRCFFAQRASKKERRISIYIDFFQIHLFFTPHPNKTMKKLIYLTLAFAAIFSTAQAQDADSTKGSFTFSGYLDTYYMANFNNPASRSNLGGGVGSEGDPIIGNARAFDQRAGQFSLGLVQAKVVHTTRKTEAVIDLTFGPNADLGNYGNVFGPLGGATSTSLAIKQAYFTYKATDKLSFTAGQFGTHIGYEVIDAPINYNYSLSNLFNNGPFYHIGAKAAYAFSDKAALMVGVVNNIDNLNDNNRAKAVISQLFVKPAEGWNVYLNWIGSNEAPSQNTPPNKGKNVEGAYYSLFDLTTSYQFTEQFLIGINAATGSEKAGSGLNARTWGGAAVYSNYAITDGFGLGVRYEYFDNTSGVRFLTNGEGGGTTVNSFTLTSNITLADGHFLLKPEFRIDSYPKLSGSGRFQKFDDSNGNFTKNTQSTLGLAAIYKF